VQRIARLLNPVEPGHRPSTSHPKLSEPREKISRILPRPIIQYCRSGLNKTHVPVPRVNL
jgi:hypothetical protein